MKRNTIVLIVCIFSLLAIVAAVGGISYAVWRESSVKQAAITPTTQENPSLRFQVFRGLDGNDNLISFRMYDPSEHGKIVKNRYVQNEDQIYYLYTKEEGEDDFSVVNVLTYEDEALYVIGSYTEYNAATHGERYYLDETTGKDKLYISSTGTPANKVVVGSAVTWYVDVFEEGVGDTFYMLEYDSENNSWYYEADGEKNDCGSIVCSTYTKGDAPVRLWHYDEDNDTYAYADNDQVLLGEDLYVAEYVEYDPSDEENVAEYGTWQYSDKTAKDSSLYLETDGEYTLASLQDIELRWRLYYHGTSYAVASANQVAAGVSLYYLKDDGEFEEATQEQISIGQHIYCGNETVSYALVGYTGTLISEVVVPDTIIDEKTQREYVVKKICASPDGAQYAFYRNKVVTAIVIPSTIEQISDVTFGDMSNLKDVYFSGAGTITIGDYAFINCENLTNIYVMPGATLLDSDGNTINWQSAVFTGCSSMTDSSFKDFQTYKPLNEGENGEEGEGGEGGE